MLATLVAMERRFRQNLIQANVVYRFEKGGDKDVMRR
jgi:hypothetical protein